MEGAGGKLLILQGKFIPGTCRAQRIRVGMGWSGKWDTHMHTRGRRDSAAANGNQTLKAHRRSPKLQRLHYIQKREMPQVTSPAYTKKKGCLPNQ